MVDGPTVGGGFRIGFGGCFGVIGAVLLIIAAGVIFGHSNSDSTPTTPAEVSNDLSVASATAGDEPWVPIEDNSKLSDGGGVSYQRSSVETYTRGFGNHNATLVARCREGHTELYINFAAYLGIDAAKVRYRFDKAPAQNGEWSISTDYKAAFAPGAVRMIKALAKTENLYVGVTPYGDNPLEVSFRMKDFSTPAADIAKRCNWKL